MLASVGSSDTAMFGCVGLVVAILIALCVSRQLTEGTSRCSTHPERGKAVPDDSETASTCYFVCRADRI
jgi:hypothetical protein